MGRLEGKVAIVTGANSGIGYAMVEKFIQEGVKVLAADLSQDVHNLKDNFGDNLATSGADVSDESDVQSMIEDGINAFGKVDILVNNAGISGPQKKYMRFPEKTINKLLELT